MQTNKVLSQALLCSIGLLLCSALMIVVDRRGLVDGLAKDVIGWSGLVISLSASFWLLIIWRSNRFRTSIGRLMILVMIVAVFSEGMLIYREWVRVDLPQRSSLIPTPIGQKPVPVDEFFCRANESAADRSHLHPC